MAELAASEATRRPNSSGNRKTRWLQGLCQHRRKLRRPSQRDVAQLPAERRLGDGAPDLVELQQEIVVAPVDPAALHEPVGVT